MLNIKTACSLTGTYFDSHDRYNFKNLINNKASLVLQQKFNDQSFSNKNMVKSFTISELPFDSNEIDKAIVEAANKFIGTYIEGVLTEANVSLILIVVWRQKILESFKYGFSLINLVNLKEKLLNLQYEVILFKIILKIFYFVYLLAHIVGKIINRKK